MNGAKIVVITTVNIVYQKLLVQEKLKLHTGMKKVKLNV